MDDDSLISTPLSDILSVKPQPMLGASMGDQEEWKPIIKKMISYYEKILVKKGDKVYLPKGSVLYHGDMGYPFVPGSKSTGNKDKMTFFGLDIEIAIWYVSELIDLYLESFFKGKPVNRYGFLYSFKLTQDLEIDLILDTLWAHPKESKICNQIGKVCLHPQVAYRGDVDYSPTIFKLSSELTLYFDIHTDQLQLDKVYIIDPLILHRNKEDISFKSRKSIVHRYNVVPETIDPKYLEVIDIDQYRTHYFGALKRKKKKKKKKKTKRKAV